MTDDRRRAQRRTTLAFVLALVCFEVVAMSVSTENLILHEHDGLLHVTAPRLHFLSGRSMQRLHDGAIVPFDFQLTIAAGVRSNVVERSLERFMISYDLWEEKFRVVRVGSARKSSRNLSANAAEAWCLENLLISSGRLPANQELWARLEVRSADPKDRETAGPDAGLSLATLIDLFSRPPRLQQDHWTVESSSFHLSDLRR